MISVNECTESLSGVFNVNERFGEFLSKALPDGLKITCDEAKKKFIYDAGYRAAVLKFIDEYFAEYTEAQS